MFQRQAFMVYMSGGGVQIFSMMIIYQLLSAAIAGMVTVNKSGRSPVLREISLADPAFRQPSNISHHRKVPPYQVRPQRQATLPYNLRSRRKRLYIAYRRAYSSDWRCTNAIPWVCSRRMIAIGSLSDDSRS